ncbi:MAG: hypothetical protein ACQEWW_21450 [Bacillota bacterium]
MQLNVFYKVAASTKKWPTAARKKAFNVVYSFEIEVCELEACFRQLNRDSCELEKDFCKLNGVFCELSALEPGLKLNTTEYL